PEKANDASEKKTEVAAGAARLNMRTSRKTSGESVRPSIWIPESEFVRISVAVQVLGGNHRSAVEASDLRQQVGVRGAPIQLVVKNQQLGSRPAGELGELGGRRVIPRVVALPLRR